MKETFLYWFGILKNTIRLWLEGNAASYAGSLAFFTLFSIAPVIILAVKVISLVMSSEAAMAEILGQLEATVGPAATEEIRNAIMNTRAPSQGILAGLLSLAVMIIGATTVFAQMQRSMNAIWEVVPRPSRNTVVALIKSRLLSLTVVVSLGFVLLVSLLLNVAVQTLLVYAENWIPFHGGIALALEVLVSIIVIALLFGMIFRLLPDVVLSWKDVAPALITAILFAIGRALIGFYLSHTATASTYGAAGSLVILLMWVYYSSMILLLGAAFSRAHSEARGRVIRARSSAVRVRREIHETPG